MTSTGDSSREEQHAPTLTAYAPWSVIVRECHHGHDAQCGLCGEPSIVHLTVHGGPRDGRLLGWLCAGCLGPADEGAGRLLQAQVAQELLDPVTGGPGRKGYRLPDPHMNGGQG